ncbi:MAG: helix-turn-helix domain-containing protein [Pseudomonadales bacterium]|nr:helix-turn-helix domain-containing protein [Pseudomonadales bacterium]
MLGISQGTVYNLVNTGQLGHYRLTPGAIRIGRHHIDDYLRRQECPVRDPQETGSSSAGPAAPHGTLTGGSTGDLNGFRLELSTRRLLDKHSPTQSAGLRIIEGGG